MKDKQIITKSQMIMRIAELSAQLQAKEQECEELKEINSQLMKYRKHSVTCQECYMDGLEDGKLYNKELHKLKQTLAEIKEIASLCSYVTPKDFYETRMKQILQKISEVLDEN